MSAPAPIEFSATLVDDISPAIEAIVASLESLMSVTEEAASSMTASFEEAVASLDEVGAAAESAVSGLDTLATAAGTSVEASTTAASSMQELATASDEVAAATETSTAALDANAAAAADATAASDAHSTSLSSVSSKMGLIGLAAAAAGGGLVVMGAQSESAFNTLQAMAGVSADQMAQYQQAADQMAQQYGVSTKQAADGIYYIVSAGFSGADALNVLNQATQAAAASNTDMKTVADALTSSLNAYGASANEAQKYQDIMTEAVVQGKQQFSDLAASIGVAAVTGHTAGFSFDQVAAAEATMTQSGLSAHRAVQDLDFLMRSIGLSTDAVAEKASKMGLTFDKNAFSSADLVGKLQYLKSITGDNTLEFEKLVGGANGLTAAEILLTNNGDTYTGILDKMKNSSGATATAFQTHTQTMQFSADRVGSSLSVMGDRFQQLVKPEVDGFLDGLSKTILSLANNSDALKNILGGLAGLIAGAVTASFVGWLAALGPVGLAIVGISIAAGLLVTHWNEVTAVFKSSEPGAVALKTALIGIGAAGLALAITTLPPMIAGFGALAVEVVLATWPFLAIGAAVAAVAFIIAEAIIHWKDIQRVIGEVMSFIGTAVHNGWELIKSAIMTAVTAIWSAIVTSWTAITTTISKAMADIWAGIQAAWNAILSAVQTVVTALWDGVKALFQAGIDLIVGIVKGFVEAIVGFWTWLYDHNYFFQQLVDTVKRLFTGIRDDAIAIWTTIVTFITNLWNDLKNTANILWNAAVALIEAAIRYAQRVISDVWNTVLDFLRGIWNTISGDVSAAWSGVSTTIEGWLNIAWGIINSLWNTIVGFLQGIWNTISGDVSNAWSNFVSTIESFVGRAGSAAGDIGNSVKSAITNLAGDAFSWGTNLIQQFINGIKNMAGSVGNAAKDIAGNIASFLGFHSPTEDGPGATSDEWAPALMAMFGSGLEDSADAVTAPLGRVMGQVQRTLTGAVPAPDLSFTPSAASPLARPVFATASSPGPYEVHIHLDGGLGAGLQLLNPTDRRTFVQQIAEEFARSGQLIRPTNNGYTGN